MTLDTEDRALLRQLLTSAIQEVDDAAQPEATIQPDDPTTLMNSYDRAKRLLLKLEVEDANPE